MSSRILGVALALLMLVPSVVRAEIGGHRLEFVLAADHIDFDDEIRFEDDLGISAAILAEIVPGLSLGLELGRLGARDRELDTFADVITMGIRARVEPFSRGRLSGGAVLGVSFLAFENQRPFDSVSEGFEAGPALRIDLDSTWRVRTEWIWRVQTVSRPRLDATGAPIGGDEETGYVWTSVLRVGVGVAF